MRGLKLAVATICCVVSTLTAAAVDGVTPGEVRIGMANALSGPAAALGLQLRAGATAYLNKVNAAGGVHGRVISLISVDDAYDPAATVRATQELIGKEHVFALFGYVGTPTSTAAVPIAVKAGVPYLFPFSGAEFLRQPVQPLVFNLRASYYDEAEALVQRLVREEGAKQIALFIQDDEFGEAGKAGVIKALARRSMKPVTEVRYPRNTIAIEVGLLQLQRARPDAVVFIGTYRPLALLAKRTRAVGLQAKLATVSFIGTSEFIKHAGAGGDGVIISQVMPSPDDASDPLVRQYQADVVPAARNYGSLEGYADAMMFVEALKRSGPLPTRERLLKELDQVKTGTGGLPFAGAGRVYLTQVKEGKAAPLAGK
jgi:branched-chain amino acid transport system substrate-binding protein